MGAISQPRPSDRRVQRTLRTLREAFISLMIERGWDDVSVQDICDRADVGRSTFYTHFADKEGLLAGGMEDLRKLLHAQLVAPAGADHPLRFVPGLIQHVYGHQRLYRALVGKRGGQVVLNRFNELITDMVGDDLARVATPGAARDTTVQFVAGGIIQLLTWWLESRNPLRPDQLEQLIYRMTTPVLQLLQPK